MRKRKEDGEAREKNLEEQLAVETSANQELQVRFFVGRMRKLLWQTAYLNLICYDSISFVIPSLESPKGSSWLVKKSRDARANETQY